MTDPFDGMPEYTIETLRALLAGDPFGTIPDDAAQYAGTVLETPAERARRPVSADHTPSSERCTTCHRSAHTRNSDQHDDGPFARQAPLARFPLNRWAHWKGEAA